MQRLLKKFFEEVTFLGGALFYLLFICLFLFNKQYFFMIILITGLFFIYSIMFIIRLFYFKPRPKKMGYNNFLEKIDASAFPSVHSARVVFLFIFLFFYFRENSLLILSSFVLMILVFCSRLFLKKHDFIDIFGGIILGIISFIFSFLIW